MKHLACGLILATSIVCHAADDKDKNIDSYLVDITGGAVSAIGLINAQGTAITPIETSQDLIVAITPLTSRDTAKNAFAVAITPAKTTLTPMPGRTYVDKWYGPLLGNLTLSYAQNQASYAGQEYQRSAFSVDTAFYFFVKEDPVYQASAAFKECADLPNEIAKQEQALNKQRNDGELSSEQFLKKLSELNEMRAAELTKCIDAALAKLAEARWNSARMSISYGEGRMHGDGGGRSYSLGKSIGVNAQYPFGNKGVTQLSVRHARSALDVDTLGAAESSYKSSSLAAVRLTYGDQAASNMRAMVEVSNSRSSSASAFKEAFMYAVGIDKKILKGTWLEFRLGRNRSVIDGKEQTTGLLTLNLAPTLFEFKK
jgi:hypothetical protein